MNDIEFTLEANPEQITAPLVRDLYALGVNRFSLGVQSFQENELKALGRVHIAQAARKAVETIQERCQNVSIDLMCGIPEQTLASWEDSLVQALQRALTHISIYPLTIEEETPFSALVDAGQIQAPDDDLQAQMMQGAAQLLHEAGFTRYEVASYARPGFTCRHNIAYWTGLPYLGLGRGAAGMRQDGSKRERLLGGEVGETLTSAQALAEDLMLGMRMSIGVSVEMITQAESLLPSVHRVFTELLDLGLVELVENRYRPTARGWLLGNQLYTRLWELQQ